MTHKRDEQLSIMLVLATNGHAGQYDRGGRPYILHPLAVMQGNPNFDSEQQAMAVGHDLIEDGKINGEKVTYVQLREAGVSERVIEGIRCLTKVPGESEDEYKAKVMSNMDAVLVKMEDLRHNSDIRRLKGITQKDIDRTIKYQRFFLELDQLVKKSNPDLKI